MRRNWITVALLIFLSACSTKQEEKVESTFPNEQPKVVNVYEHPVFGEPFKAKRTEYYESGAKRMEGNLNPDEERTGVWNSWYEDGTLWSTGTYIDGQRSGNGTVWYRSGQKKMEGHYNEGSEHGPWTFWNETGKLQRTVNFEKGKENGLSTEYYPAGKKKSEGQYKAGKRIGAWKFWGPSGGLQKETIFDSHGKTSPTK